jgi:hypothetical protein
MANNLGQFNVSITMLDTARKPVAGNNNNNNIIRG